VVGLGKNNLPNFTHKSMMKPRLTLGEISWLKVKLKAIKKPKKPKKSKDVVVPSGSVIPTKSGALKK